MPLISLSELAEICGSDRRTVRRRAVRAGLEPVDGPKNAKLYDSASARTATSALPPLPI